MCVCSGSCLCGCCCCCQRSIRRRFLDAIRTESTFTITKGTRRESGKGIGIGESTTIVVVIQIVVVVGSFLLLLLPTWPLLCAQLQVITVSSHLPPAPAHAAAVSTHNIHIQKKLAAHVVTVVVWGIKHSLHMRHPQHVAPSLHHPSALARQLRQINNNNDNNKAVYGHRRR